MVWDGNGYPVKRCCAKCRTPYNCGNARCACHDDPAFGSERPDLGAQGDFQGSGVLGDSCESSTAQAADFGNETTRRN